MDSEKYENKAKPTKKRSLQIVNEHFEEALTQLSCFVAFVNGLNVMLGYWLTDKIVPSHV